MPPQARIKIKLTRVSHRADGEFGIIELAGMPICLTLERPWLQNEKMKSCIPAGSYLCRRVLSPKFGDTFEVTNVPSRTNILFHGGNIVDDSLGCIMLGEQFNIWKDGRCSITSSRVAVAEFMQALKLVDSFDLQK